jgi:mannose-6-phosphate isomerase-like protein (cupin superfamily)
LKRLKIPIWLTSPDIILPSPLAKTPLICSNNKNTGERNPMADINSKKIEEINYYQGPHAIQGIKFRTAARELGVTAWGMNVIEIDSGCTAYPEHDHVADGQEEVYVVLKGSGTLVADEKETSLTAGTLVRVGPSTKRKILPGSSGMTVLALGATPGKAYSPRT